MTKNEVIAKFIAELERNKEDFSVTYRKGKSLYIHVFCWDVDFDNDEVEFNTGDVKFDSFDEFVSHAETIGDFLRKLKKAEN